MESRIVIIAALEREVWPLVRNWPVQPGIAAGYRSFAKDDVLVVCAGIGAQAAQRSAAAVLASQAPRLVVSAGLAGALTPQLHVGQVVLPAEVIHSPSGRRFQTEFGQLGLVSTSEIAGPEAKRLLAWQHQAQLVDMEAASVALLAEERKVPFFALKAVSDEHDFVMPELEPFVTREGRFRTGAFTAHVALHPRLWGPARQLAANSEKAAQALCRALRELAETGSLKSMGFRPSATGQTV
jgi:adenosylhomocysteine nucleosidase